MAIPYERLVTEDLNRGWGPVDVTMPAGGIAVGTKVGIHAFLGEHYNVQDFGAVGDGITDDTAAIQLAITTCAAGGVVWFPRVAAYYRITDALSIPKAMTVDGGGAQIRLFTAGKNAFTVTASNVTIRNVALFGKQFAANNSNLEAGIACVGASAAVPYTNLTIEHCAIRNFGDYGINLQWVTDFRIEHCDIQDIFYAGIAVTSALRGHISHNRIRNIPGSSLVNAYGIAISRIQNDSLVTHPRSADIVVSGNVIQDVTNWEGIDTHGGQRITISGNTLLRCKMGIVATSSKNTAGVVIFAPLDIAIVGNTVESGVTDGTAWEGILLIGPGVTPGVRGEEATGVIANNVIRGHGEYDSGVGVGGILVRATHGVVVSGNVCYECSPNGINFWYDNYHFVCTGNTIIDPFGKTVGAGQAVGIYLRQPGNGGFIGNNTIVRSSRVFGAGIESLTYGIRTTAGAPVEVVTFGLNRIIGASTAPIYDGSGGMLEFSGGLVLPGYMSAEQVTTPPTAPTGTRAKLFFRDTGFTRGELVARFPTGSVQKLVREPRYLVAGNIALSAGWGNTATLNIIDGTDFYGKLQVQANGAGIAAFPTITITFNNSVFESGLPPYGMAQRNDGNAPTTAVVTWTSTLTTFVMAFNGLPVAGTNYNFAWMLAQ